MKNIAGLLLLSTVIGALPVHAQYKNKPGDDPSPAAALTPDMLKTLQGEVPMTPELQAVRNVLANNGVRALILNPDVANRTDKYFNHEIKTPGSITDQQNSGRCWLFAGLNMLRPGVISKDKMKDFMLSQAYEQFYEKLEGANRSLDLAISLRKEPIHSRRLDTLLAHMVTDGGNWNYVRSLVDKYGAVPESVMPDDYAASHSGEMIGLMSARLRKAVIELRSPKLQDANDAELQTWKMNALKDVYKILVLCLGQPPESFPWRYEDKNGKVTALAQYTPMSFRQKFVDANLGRYADFVNYPGQPMHAHLEWAWEREMADQPNMEAVNITMPEMVDMVQKSILANEPVWFGANAGAEGDGKKGLWLDGIQDKNDLFGIDFSLSKEEELSYDNGGPDHAMVITGVDIQNGKPVKWKVENSWGDKAGDKGWFTIDDQWFEKHVYQVIIDPKFVPGKLMDLTKQKATMLPPWDPFADWAPGGE
ncbi:MAG TPA: C1 family peptidase [Verrucomicrobiae bacterium]|jgi:bleomycin hydrolase